MLHAILGKASGSIPVTVKKEKAPFGNQVRAYDGESQMRNTKSEPYDPIVSKHMIESKFARHN